MSSVKETVEYIVKQKDEYLNIDQYNQIKALIDSNKIDMFFWSIEKMESTFPKLHELLSDAEMYFGFTENEIKSFLSSVNELGFTFDYVDVATQNNQFSHSFKPYYLRQI